MNGKSNKSMMHLRTTKWVVKEYIAGKLKEAKMAQLKKNKKKVRGKKKEGEHRTGKSNKSK